MNPQSIDELALSFNQLYNFQMNHLSIARALTKLLDRQFKIGNFSFGLDPLLGIFPWLGDVIGLLLSGYILWIATQLRLPEKEIARMTRNIMIDFVLGLFPIVGDLSDFVYKANSKNMDILERFLEKDKKILDGEVIPAKSS